MIKDIWWKIKFWVLDVVSDIKAWRRGERRVAERGKGFRGRVYEKTGRSPFTGSVKTKARGNAVLKMKILRANGTVEEVDVPAKVSPGNPHTDIN